MNCAIDNRPACDETEGWTIRLCVSCWEACGEPGIEPKFGAVYGISSVVLAAEEQRHEHPEVQAYHMHVNPVELHG